MTYLYLGRTGFLRNTAYRWSHMVNNRASLLFGFIYLSLWQAVAPEATSGGDPYTRSVMVSIIVLAQVAAWLTVFLPAGLGIHAAVRTGAIAMEMARPIPYFPMVIAREAGNLVYNGLYRSLPLALLFAATVGFPRPGSIGSLILSIPSLLLGSYIGLSLAYLVGISALWTHEIRWAQWAYHSLVGLLSGGWIPADLLPGWLGRIAPYLPFAGMQYYPVRTYLGLSGVDGLLVQAAWAAALTLACLWITRRAFLRVVVQGG